MNAVKTLSSSAAETNKFSAAHLSALGASLGLPSLPGGDLPGWQQARRKQNPAGESEREIQFAQFRPLVQRLIRKYGDSPEMRNDLEGEIYCIFCHLYDAFDPNRGVPLKAYLVHQLTTSTYTFARRQWGQARREVCMEVREDTTSDLNPSRQWDNDLMMEQARGHLAEAIAQLPVRQKQVVIWRYYEHRSFEEIAETLNVQTATTRSLLRHGMNNLRKYFEVNNLAL